MLKQLKINYKLKEKRALLTALQEKIKAFDLRQSQLETALEEATTDEDLALLNTSIEELESEMEAEDTEKSKQTLVEEIDGLEEELINIGKPEDGNGEIPKERGAVNKMNKYQAREAFKNGTYHERADVKEFYNDLKNIRSIAGSELLIPDIIINRIMDMVGDYSTLYNLVDKIKLKGKGRILLDTDTTEASWIEQNGVIPEGETGTITNVDFDGYKVGKIIFVDNCLIEDSIINVDDYVCKRIAKALGKAIEKATLVGEGPTKKQPTGIVPSLSDTHKVVVNNPKIIDIVKHIGLIDTGEEVVGEIIAIMKRQTYYNHLLGFSINVDSNGNVVGKLPNLNNLDLLGLKVEFSQYMAEDEILFGDFNKYTLVEREDITVDNSIHVKYAADQTAFRGKGRFDGKAVNKDAFVLVSMKFPVAPETVSEEQTGE